MPKRNKIIYWAATIWLALGMTVTGVGQLIRMKTGAGGTDSITHLGYPVYILTLLGMWKVLGVVTVLMPRFPRLKEWAYAGFFFLMTGALFSHFVARDAATEFLGPALLLILNGLSWYFRPADRKVLFSESRGDFTSKKRSSPRRWLKA